MQDGEPKIRKVKVEGKVTVGSIKEVLERVKLNAHVLDITSTSDGTYVNSCAETPALNTCKPCFERFRCSFSHAKER